MSINLQEYALKYANNQLAKINSHIANIAGVEVMWFRAHPQDRSTDVIFQTYTLHNVDKCPLSLKVLYSEAQYDDVALTFSFNGIEYKPTLTIEIPIETWKTATNNDGTLPQEKDIIFVPMTRKLWQVKSMTPVSAMAGQITSYKSMLETYRPEADRHISGDLKEAIEGSTTSIDRLFGDLIDETMKDLTNDKQSSQFSSTEKDKYKNIGGNTEKGLFQRLCHTKTTFEEINIDGHLAGRSFYSMKTSGPYAVEYKNIYDEINSEDTRCLSVLFRISEHSEKEYNIFSIKETRRNPQNSYLEIEINANEANNFSKGDTIIIKRNTIIIVGSVTAIEKRSMCIKVPTEILKHYDSVDGWKEIPGFSVSVSSPVNLLSGESQNGNFDISIYANKYIVVNMPEKQNIIYIKDTLKNNIWYSVILNMRKKATLNVFKCIPNLEKIQENTFVMDWVNNVVTNYYIKPSNSDMTNIRLYNIANDNIDKQLTDIVSYNISNGSKAIINDSADLWIDNKYYGKQR